MHSGYVAAMPPARNEATFSFCQASRSVRMTTAILVSNCTLAPLHVMACENFADGLNELVLVDQHLRVSLLLEVLAAILDRGQSCTENEILDLNLAAGLLVGALDQRARRITTIGVFHLLT